MSRHTHVNGFLREKKMKFKQKIPINHLCQEHPSDCLFESMKLVPGKELKNLNKEVNYLIFFLTGKVKITSNLFEETLFETGDIFFLPRFSDSKMVVLEETKILVHTFDHSSCNSLRCILNHLYIYSKNPINEVPYVCKLKMVPAFQPYAESILIFLKDNFNDSFMWYVKHQEAIRILKNYYSRDEIRSFLHPMLHESVPFRSLVLTHAKYANNAEELAYLCDYGVVNFRRLFKKQFGVSVAKWLQSEKAKRIRYTLTTSELSIKEIMNEYDFYSASHFSKFCKRHLGDIPSNIRKLANMNSN